MRRRGRLQTAGPISDNLAMTRPLLICGVALALSGVAGLPAPAGGERLLPQKPEPARIVVPGEVRALPGALDSTPVLNSNCPEIVQTEGILDSTFPPGGMKTPQAHLNLPLKGRIDVFAHHIARAPSEQDLRTLYLGLIVHNPSKRRVRVRVLSGASYLSQPDAPFVTMPALLPNDDGRLYSGPGDRVTDDVLRGRRQEGLPASLVLAAGADEMLVNLPVPVRQLKPPLNGRSVLLKLKTDAPVYLASLAMYAPADGQGKERAPTLAEWRKLLVEGALAGPREGEPTVPGAVGDFRYGRVAGVSRGSRWLAKIDDPQPHRSGLHIPEPGQSYSYILSAVDRKTLGTGQVQCAELLRRYPDTAYSAHGNYAVHYQLTFPLYNPAGERRKVLLEFETPAGSDGHGLIYNDPPGNRIFFRGTVRLSWRKATRAVQSEYFHLSENEGEIVPPLASFTLGPKEHKTVVVDFIYPPDATPPQVITVRTASAAESTGTW